MRLSLLNYFGVFISLVLVYIQHTDCSLSGLEQYVYFPLDLKYVKQELITKFNQPDLDVTTHVLKIHTLKWFDDNFSSRSVWWHYLYINVPLNLPKSQRQTAVLFLSEGFNTDVFEKNPVYNILKAKLAGSCNCITATVRNIPNQPIVFTDDPTKTERNEDSIVAWTFKLYLEALKKNSNPPWSTSSLPLLVPMVKAVVRTMNAIEIYMISIKKPRPSNFILAGGSKRGWTAWLAGAIDKRVVGIIPIVFDLLNIRQNFHNQYRLLNAAYSFTMYDYLPLSLSMDTSGFSKMEEIVDPYRFLDKFTGKKILMVSAANDEFLMPTNLRAYWDILRVHTIDNCYLRRLPNAVHRFLANDTAPDAPAFYTFIGSFVSSFLKPQTYILPKITWNFDNQLTQSTINVKLENIKCPNVKMTVYAANTLDNKKIDFRFYYFSNGKLGFQEVYWAPIRQENLTVASSHELKISHSLPFDPDNFQYWTGYFIQFAVNINADTCDDSVGRNLIYLTTETNIIPEMYPVADCFGASCAGPLV